MDSYKLLVNKILSNGSYSTDRTGVGTYRTFGTRMEFDLADGFPLLTLKYTHFPAIAHELLWFISGNTNTAYLKENKVSIWDEWADADGNLGPIYGHQWRHWKDGTPGGKDQLKAVIELINNDPDSRRIIISAWNVTDIPRMALPPCHAFMQFFVQNGELSLQIYQRSADMMLGVPFNIASYALLLKMVAHVTGKVPAKLVWVGGDTHIYSNHVEGARMVLKRESLPLPQLQIINTTNDIDQIKFSDFRLVNYRHHGKIKFDIAV